MKTKLKKYMGNEIGKKKNSNLINYLKKIIS